MSSGWTQRTLDELADYHNGRAFKPSDWAATGFPIIRIAQITNPDAQPNCYNGDDLDSRHLINDGDLLFSWSATLAVLKWNRGPAVLNQHIFKVVERQGVHRDFLRHLLGHALPDLVERSHGSTMKHIRKGVLREYRVPVPSLPEQRKIAAILSSVDDAIEKTQAVIDQVQVVKRGLMQELLTRGLPGRHTRFKQTEIGEIPEDWQLRKLAEVAIVQTGLAKNKANAGSLSVPYLRVANVQDGFLDLTEMKSVEVNETALSRYALKDGDVLFTEGGDADKLGRGTVWNGEIQPCLHQNHVFVARALGNLRPKFLSLYGGSSRGKSYFLNCSKQTTNLASMNSTQLKSLPVPIPGLDEQDEILERIGVFDDRLKLEEGCFNELNNLKSSLMAVLLTGELRVTPDTEAA